MVNDLKDLFQHLLAEVAGVAVVVDAVGAVVAGIEAVGAEETDGVVAGAAIDGVADGIGAGEVAGEIGAGEDGEIGAGEDGVIEAGEEAGVDLGVASVDGHTMGASLAKLYIVRLPHVSIINAYPWVLHPCYLLIPTIDNFKVYIH